MIRLQVGKFVAIKLYVSFQHQWTTEHVMFSVCGGVSNGFVVALNNFVAEYIKFCHLHGCGETAVYPMIGIRLLDGDECDAFSADI